MSNQGDRQASFRALGGTALNLEGDMLAAFAAASPARTVGTFNERFMLWLQDQTGSAATSLPQLMQLYADGQGVTNWSSVDTVGPVLDLNFLAMGGVLDSRITWSRASTASFFDVTGTLQTAAINTPRFDFDPSAHTLTGLLIEASATNFLLNSGAPVTQTTASLATGTYTLWLVGTGTATSSAGTATATGLGAASAGSPNVFTVTVAGTVVITVAGSPTRFQLENGAGPTSYIPTTAATVTRSADIGTIPIANFPWNPNAGSIAAQFVVGDAAINNQYIVGANVGAEPLFISSTGKINTYDGAAGQAITANSLVVGGVTKAATAWGTSSAAVLNNGTVATNTWNNAIMATAASLKFGTGLGLNPVTQIWLQRVRYANSQLSATQLQALTV